jgi:hypothetical protein
MERLSGKRSGMTQHIWKVKNDIDHYASVILDAKSMYKQLYFEGKPIKDHWPLQMTGQYYQLNEAEQTIRPIPDVAYLSPGMFTCTMRCKNATIFQRATLEFLPISLVDTTIWAVNVLEIFDCLDEDASDIERFKSSGRVKRINRYAFRETMIHQSVLIFKIPQMVRTEIYATDQFKEKIEIGGVTGLKFNLLYSWECDQ